MASILKLREHIAKVKDLYTTRPVCFNALIMGKTGTGKTYLASTCRKPILMHSFDPGGSKTAILQPMIASGEMVVDASYEKDDANNPTAFRSWEQTITMLKQENAFKYFGTYFVDSLTSLGTCIMNKILYDEGHKNSVPQQRDYLLQQIGLVNIIKDLMNLPCDVIMTGHIGIQKDEVTGKMEATLFISGQLVVKIPMLFDEIYIAQGQSTSQGTEYRLLTSIDGIYQARSRIGGAKFEKFEKPNMKNLLKKAGYPSEDLPPLSESLKGDEKDALNQAKT